MGNAEEVICLPIPFHERTELKKQTKATIQKIDSG